MRTNLSAGASDEAQAGPARVIFATEANGFGPVAKLAAIAKQLGDVERVFVGDDGAYEFARRNVRLFDRIFTIAEFAAQPQFAKTASFAIVVMEPDIAFMMRELGVPVFLFDSLLDFWTLPNGMAPLADAARQIQSADRETARSLFLAFPMHERKVIAHMLATRSFAQNFPGVPERIAELRHYGWNTTELIGSIIDLTSQPPERDGGPAGPQGWTMLINLGGVRNFLISFHVNDHVIDLMEKWAARFLADNPDCRKIILCSGRFAAESEQTIGNSRLILRFASHEEFVGLIREADVILSAPGRTLLHEALALGKPPLLLPEQHYNQYVNLRSLAHTALGALSLPLDDIVDMGALPDSDHEGTEMILATLRQIFMCDALFDIFDKKLRERLRLLRALMPDEKELLLREILPICAGRSLAEVVGEIAGNVGNARQDRP